MFDPVRHLVAGSCRLAPTDGKAWFHSGPRADPVQILFAVPHAAAFVGAKGQDAFARQIEMLQKGEHGHGHGAAPVGIAQKMTSYPSKLSG